ncbi:MAG: substrate-binding domain-containing protein [Lentisphaeria bacterium]|nr:substrate-binding domain-containing protein [Lentisphaeria bacterium]
MTDPDGKTLPAENAPPRRPRRLWWRILLAVPATALIVLVCLGGYVGIMFGSLSPGVHSLLWLAGMISVEFFVLAALFGWKLCLATSGAAALFCAAVFGGMEAHRYFTVTRYRQIRDRIDWYAYRPFAPQSRVVRVAADPAFRMAGTAPNMSAAFALYPLCAGTVQALYSEQDFDRTGIDASGSDVIYDRLLRGEVDLIFGLPPSEQQKKAAEELELKFEITPFAREAFVFFVNRRNPVTGLTCDQIRGIYSGRITRWEETGSGSGPIRPFQRNRGSGSQTMLQRIMGATPLMPPIKEDRLGGMGGIINDVADYRNHVGALGFSFRFFASEMFRNDDIRLLALDGVAPTRENIRSGRYPFITDCCVVTVKPRDENVRKIVDFLRSPAGCEMIEKTGYTPLALPEAGK